VLNWPRCFFLFSSNLWGRWTDKPPEEDLAKFGYKPESKVELFWTPLDILAMILEVGVKIWRIFFFPPQNMATLCHFFSKEILCKIQILLPPAPFCFVTKWQNFAQKKNTGPYCRLCMQDVLHVQRRWRLHCLYLQKIAKVFELQNINSSIIKYWVDNCGRFNNHS